MDSKQELLKLYEQIKDTELSNILENLLIFKSDYDHNHDDKYAKLSNVYTREEIESIFNRSTLNLNDMVSNDELKQEINQAISELKNIDTNISNHIDAINKISNLEDEINILKTEKESLKQKLLDVETKYNDLVSKVKPLLDVSDALIYSANNIVNYIKIDNKKPMI